MRSSGGGHAHKVLIIVYHGPKCIIRMCDIRVWLHRLLRCQLIPDSKVHRANMRPTWDRQDPGGPHAGHMKITIWGTYILSKSEIIYSSIQVTAPTKTKRDIVSGSVGIYWYWLFVLIWQNNPGWLTRFLDFNAIVATYCFHLIQFDEKV